MFRINFNGGDVIYWNGQPAFPFRENLKDLPAFLEERFQSLSISDMILFGDCRPVHRIAIEAARRKGIRIHVYEEGYFRPYWVTLERNGVNAHSLLPRDPDWYWRVGANLPDYGDGESFTSPLRLRAMHDVNYHLDCIVNPVLFPGYRTHCAVTAPLEYAGYLRRYVALPFYRRRDKKVLDSLIADGVPFFLLPLQLNNDAQIRDHSSFSDMKQVMEYVMESFVRSAPGDARLVIKNHPLDSGLHDYAGTICRLERRFDLSGRIHYVETGDLVGLLSCARGVVTVNSTVGGWSLSGRCPTIALSDPIYNLSGLTFQGKLDEFWQNPEAPDMELFRRFRNTVIHTTQVNGGFYSPEGIGMAVRNSIRLLTAEKSPLEELL
ncbi:MAG: capsular biosynthesis protein [Syntrophobacteraceae bacterium]|nr:capsular biosynthesis protein [Desulfobacteraceae bacterium]